MPSNPGICQDSRPIFMRSSTQEASALHQESVNQWFSAWFNRYYSQLTDSQLATFTVSIQNQNQTPEYQNRNYFSGSPFRECRRFWNRILQVQVFRIAKRSRLRTRLIHRHYKAVKKESVRDLGVEERRRVQEKGNSMNCLE